MENTQISNTVSMPRIGEIAPSFEAITTQGNIKFPSDYPDHAGLLKKEWREQMKTPHATIGFSAPKNSTKKPFSIKSSKNNYIRDWAFHNIQSLLKTKI